MLKNAMLLKIQILYKTLKSHFEKCALVKLKKIKLPSYFKREESSNNLNKAKSNLIGVTNSIS